MFFTATYSAAVLGPKEETDLSSMDIQFLGSPLESMVEFPPLPKVVSPWAPVVPKQALFRATKHQDLFRATKQPDHLIRATGKVEKGKCKLFIFGINPRMKEHELKSLFSTFGLVTNVHNSLKGYAFVTFNRMDEGEAAINGMDNQVIDGKRLKVSIAKAKVDIPAALTKPPASSKPPAKFERQVKMESKGKPFITNRFWSLLDDSENDGRPCISPTLTRSSSKNMQKKKLSHNKSSFSHQKPKRKVADTKPSFDSADSSSTSCSHISAASSILHCKSFLKSSLLVSSYPNTPDSTSSSSLFSKETKLGDDATGWTIVNTGKTLKYANNKCIALRNRFSILAGINEETSSSIESTLKNSKQVKQSIERRGKGSMSNTNLGLDVYGGGMNDGMVKDGKEATLEKNLESFLAEEVGDSIIMNGYVADKEDLKSLFGPNYVSDGALNLLLNLHCDSVTSEEYEFMVIGTDLLQAIENDGLELATQLYLNRYQTKHPSKAPFYILPICQNNHWVLAFYQIRKGICYARIYDPLNIRPRKSVENLLEKFSLLVSNKGNIVFRYMNGPLQLDSVNCGIFVYCFAKMVIKNRTEKTALPSDFSSFDVHNERVEILRHMSLIFQFDFSKALELHGRFFPKSLNNIKSPQPNLSMHNEDIVPCTTSLPTPTSSGISISPPFHTPLGKPKKLTTLKDRLSSTTGKTIISSDIISPNQNIMSPNKSSPAYNSETPNNSIYTTNKSFQSTWTFENSGNCHTPHNKCPIFTPTLSKFQVLGLATPASSEDYLPIHVSVSPLKIPNDISETSINFPDAKKEQQQDDDPLQSFYENLSKNSPLKRPTLVLTDSSKRKAGTPLKSSCSKKVLSDDSLIPGSDNSSLNIKINPQKSKRALFNNTDVYIDSEVMSKEIFMLLPTKIEHFTNCIIFSVFKKIEEKVFTINDFYSYLSEKYSLSTLQIDALGINETFVNTFVRNYEGGLFTGYESEIFENLRIPKLLEHAVENESLKNKIDTLESEIETLRKLVRRKGNIEKVSKEHVPSPFVENCSLDGLESCFYGREFLEDGKGVRYGVYMKIHTFSKKLVTNICAKNSKTMTKRAKQMEELIGFYSGKTGNTKLGTERLVTGFLKAEKELVVNAIEAGNVSDVKIAKKLNVEQSAFLLSELGGSYNILRKKRRIFKHVKVDIPFVSEDKIRQFNRMLLDKIIPRDNQMHGRMTLAESAVGGFKSLEFWRVIDFKRWAQDMLNLMMMSEHSALVIRDNIKACGGEILMALGADHGGNVTIEGASTQKYCAQFFHLPIFPYVIYKGSDTAMNQHMFMADYYQQFVELQNEGLNYGGELFKVRYVDKGDMKQSNLALVGMLTNAGIYPCRFDYATKEFMANKSTPLVKEEVSFELRTVAGSNYFFHKNYFTNSGNLEKMRENQKYFGNVRYMGIYPLRSIYDQCIDVLHADIVLTPMPLAFVTNLFRERMTDDSQRREILSLEQVINGHEDEIGKIDNEKINISEKIVYFREKIIRMEIVLGRNKTYSSLNQYYIDTFGSSKVVDGNFGKWDFDFNCPRCLFTKYDRIAKFRPCPTCSTPRHPYCCEDSDMTKIGYFEQDLPCSVCSPVDLEKRIESLENFIETNNVKHVQLTKQTNFLAAQSARCNERIEKYKCKAERALDKKLEEIGVRRASFRGNQLVGAHCKKILENYEDIVALFPDDVQNLFLEYYRVVKQLIYECSSVKIYPPEKIILIKSLIAELGKIFPVIFGKVIPKVYDIVVHLGSYLDRNKTVGMFNSEDLERIHRE